MVAAFVFFFVSENETETKRKRSINGVFDTLFEFFRNVLDVTSYVALQRKKLQAFLL